MKLKLIDKFRNSKLTTPLSLAFVLVSNIAPSQAVQFNFTYAHGTRQEVIDGFEKAGSLWSSKLQDTYLDSSCFCQRNTTVNIFINFEELSNSKALGGARPAMVRVNYQDFVSELFQNISSQEDLLAVKNLQINNLEKTSKNLLSSFGVNNYDTDAQVKTFLSEAGLTLNPNQTVTEQSQNIFNQLNLEQIKNLNRNATLLDTSQFRMIVNKSSTVAYEHAAQLKSLGNDTILDDNGNNNNKNIWLTRANAKALDIVKGNDNRFDGQIVLRSSMLNSNGEVIPYSNWLENQLGEGDFRQDSIWDFSRVYSDNATVDNNKYDFLTVAQHEIGHILGVVSGVDTFDVLTNMVAAEDSVSQPLTEEDLQFVSSMDLFRHSHESKNKGIFDWSHGGGKYFSIDGGVTKLADFDGTNYQGSHWSADADSPLGIMHPILKTGQSIDISDLDLKLLDVIGWDRNSGFADKTGLNLDMETADGAITSRVKSIGLHWNQLEDLLIKPAAAYLSEMAQERAALAPSEITRLQTELQDKKTQLAIEQAALEVEQDKIEALKVVISDLDARLQTLNSLENIADELASKANPVIIKEKLAQLKTQLDDKLSNLRNLGDGPRRRQEEQNILAQIVNLAQEQEQAWNQVITAHEFSLFSQVELQVRQWLQTSPEELKNYMANATRKQTLLLMQVVDSATGEAKAQWQSKVQKALMLLNNIDEDKANELLAQLTEELQKSGANDHLISRSRGPSTARGNRYWQEMDIKFLDARSYTETVYTAESGLENATFNQLFDAKLEELDIGNSQAVSVQEPSALAGFGPLGLWGIGWLFQRRRRRKDNDSYTLT
jgi:hypothetical protein